MIDAIINQISNIMYSYLLIILLLAVGLYFTVRTKFIQFRMFGESILVVGEKPDKAGSISSFQALMVSTASRVGTGNIIGISTAICCGGFGAVFWMWIIAIIGGASAFIESTLAQIYKRRDPETGESYGGPSYYIEAALHSRILAVIFAVALILTYAGGFNMLASYNLQSTFSSYSFYNPESTPWVIGAILAVLVGYCVMGGGKRILKVTSTLVPFMGGLYVLVALIVLVMNIGSIPYVFGRIFSEAFDFQAIFAGFAGSAMMYGIKRGLYSNEAGVGSAPNAAASANVSHPVKQGLVQMLSVFIDTLLICTATAFMLLCSGVEPDEACRAPPMSRRPSAASLVPSAPCSSPWPWSSSPSPPSSATCTMWITAWPTSSRRCPPRSLWSCSASTPCCSSSSAPACRSVPCGTWLTCSWASWPSSTCPSSSSCPVPPWPL